MREKAANVQRKTLKTFSRLQKAGELLQKTTFEYYHKNLAPWKQNMKKWVAQHFCTYCTWWLMMNENLKTSSQAGDCGTNQLLLQSKGLQRQVFVVKNVNWEQTKNRARLGQLRYQQEVSQRGEIWQTTKNLYVLRVITSVEVLKLATETWCETETRANWNGQEKETRKTWQFSTWPQTQEKHMKWTILM